MVKVAVSPLSDSKICKVGSLAMMDICITQATGNKDPPETLLYEIDGSSMTWAVSGKSTGNMHEVVHILCLVLAENR